MISIDKILAFLQVFEYVISMFTTAQSGIWVGQLMTSLREPSSLRGRRPKGKERGRAREAREDRTREKHSRDF